MSVRQIGMVLVVGMAAIAYLAWTRSSGPGGGAQEASLPAEPPPTARAGSGDGTPQNSDAVEAVPHVTWTKPPSWTACPDRPMRLATYGVPAAPGADEAECAVYYFGPDQGGPTEANIDRWIGEFQGPSTPELRTRRIHGLEVSQVRVRGTYVAHAGPADESIQPKQQLLGAVVEAPGGSVFFKLTGPATTVDAAAQDFDRMLASLQKN